MPENGSKNWRRSSKTQVCENAWVNPADAKWPRSTRSNMDSRSGWRFLKSVRSKASSSLSKSRKQLRYRGGNYEGNYIGGGDGAPALFAHARGQRETASGGCHSD